MFRMIVVQRVEFEVQEFGVKIFGQRQVVKYVNRRMIVIIEIYYIFFC